jgi:hypothetical protein
MKRLDLLSNDDLLQGLRALVSSHGRVTADLIAHLAEMDARRLHVEKGFPSLFSYCVEELHFSEDEACRRIEAARAVRKFPEIATLLESGAVSLTVLGLLKIHLTDDNHEDLLRGVSGSSVRQAKEWLAARFPLPDVPSSIRKLPERGKPRSRQAQRFGGGAASPPHAFEATARTPGVPFLPAPERGPVATSESTTSPPAPTRVTNASGSTLELRSVSLERDRSRVEPLSKERYLVKFTASKTLRDKLEIASDLMRHISPSGDLATVIERAVDLLVAELEKRKQGKTKSHAALESGNARSKLGARFANQAALAPNQAALASKCASYVVSGDHVARSVRREVVARDGWRCSFVANDGRRCGERTLLEFDHRIPKALGGSSTADNLRLLCRAHNRWAAERIFGKALVARAIEARQKPNPARPLPGPGR